MYFERYFQRHQGNVFLEPKNSNPVVFGNADFGELKDHNVTTKPFQKYFLLWNI